ncbi:MAG: lysophospholipid acyltransferase family protein [Bacteroidota bacterium]
MNKIPRFLASCYFWFELFFISGLLFPASFLIFLLTFLFDRRLVVLHQFTCFWSFIVLKANFMWRISVVGREKIDKHETYVIVSNHQSGADIIVLFLLWNNYKWVAKRSLYNFPFIGWNMWLNRYIVIDRGKKSSMVKMMNDAAKTLRSGSSVMIFPEGTRSKDGRLQPFKTGAFHLALETGRPILPVVITGTSMAIRKGGFLVNKNHDIQAKVLTPIPYASFKGMEPRDVTRMVYEIMLKESENRPVK